jgi:hypothetical protein
MENKYFVKHKRQTLADFQKDIHKFSFWYKGQKTASCVGGVSVFFEDEAAVPEDVKEAVQATIYQLIDQNEGKWSAPKGAQQIADAYCAEEFT